jgi:hypothetical protein
LYTSDRLLVDALPAVLALFGVLDDGLGRGKLPQVGESVQGETQYKEGYHLTDKWSISPNDSTVILRLVQGVVARGLVKVGSLLQNGKLLLYVLVQG